MRKKLKTEWSVLTNLNDETRKKVISYMHDNQITLNAFAKECNVGQPNLHVFINGKTLAVHNLERIWTYFEKMRYS